MVYVIYIYVIYIRTFCPDPALQGVSKSVWYIPLLCVLWKTPDDGQRNCQKHVEFYSKNKLEELVHIFGFIIRIFHDARSPERQNVCVCVCVWPCLIHKTHLMQFEVFIAFAVRISSRMWGSSDPTSHLTHKSSSSTQFALPYVSFMKQKIRSESPNRVWCQPKITCISILFSPDTSIMHKSPRQWEKYSQPQSLLLCANVICRLRLKCDGTRAETRFRLLAQRASPFKSAGEGISSVDYWQPRCAHQR